MIYKTESALKSGLTNMAVCSLATDRIKSFYQHSHTEPVLKVFLLIIYLFFCHLGRWVGKLKILIKLKSHKSTFIPFAAICQKCLEEFSLQTGSKERHWSYCHCSTCLTMTFLSPFWRVYFCHWQLEPRFSFSYSQFSQVSDSHVVTSSTVLAMDS